MSGGGTGYFRLGQIGDRWTFVTPLGNAFLQKGIMVWSPVTARLEPNIRLKYGDARTAGFYTPWALIRAARWGINTIGWGLGIYHFPVSFLNQGRTVELLGCGFPMVPNHGVAHGAAARGGNKDPVRMDGLGVKIAAWPPGGFRRPGCDMGDPHFTGAVQAAIDRRKGEFKGFDITTSPWLLANSIDDADYFFMHKGGVSLHPGWVAAITAPIQNASSTGIVYDGLSGRTDGIVYMKQVLYRNYLQQKYKTIGALNAAWGSNYTTFGSSNPSNPLDGWLSGTGTGLMDEDGVRHSWMKLVMPFQNISDLTGFPAQVKIDLEEVTEVMVEHFYNQYATKFRAAYPNHLLMGPSALKQSLGRYKPGVLRAAGRVFDYLQMDYTPGPGGDEPSDLVRSYNLAKKPIVAWKAAVAYPESAAQRRNSTVGTVQGEGEPRQATSQTSKAGLYETNLDTMFTATGDDGRKFWLGFDNWNAWDQHSEGINWGFLTEGDNAYDGRQTKVFGLPASALRRGAWMPSRSMITDETGHPITRWSASADNQLYERDPYGDFITGLRQATRKAEFYWLSLVGAQARTH